MPSKKADPSSTAGVQFSADEVEALRDLVTLCILERPIALPNQRELVSVIKKLGIRQQVVAPETELPVA